MCFEFTGVCVLIPFNIMLFIADYVFDWFECVCANNDDDDDDVIIKCSWLYVMTEEICL